jgi:hypothetical protein
MKAHFLAAAPDPSSRTARHPCRLFAFCITRCSAPAPRTTSHSPHFKSEISNFKFALSRSSALSNERQPSANSASTGTALLKCDYRKSPNRLRLPEDFHISEISTSKNVSGLIDSFSVQRYNGFAEAFQPSESWMARRAKA